MSRTCSIRSGDAVGFFSMPPTICRMSSRFASWRTVRTCWALEQRLAGRKGGGAAAAEHLRVAVESVPEFLGERVLAADVRHDAVQPSGQRLRGRQVG